MDKKKKIDNSHYSGTWPPKSIVDAVADSNIRVVVAAANCGYLDMLHNFVSSLIRCNITNFVLVPLDETAYIVLSKMYPGHVVPLMSSITSISGEQLRSGEENKIIGSSESIVKRAVTFIDPKFRQLVQSRPSMIRLFVEAGYSVLYCDSDTVWQSNFFDIYDVNNSNRHESKDHFDMFLVRDHPTALVSVLPEQFCSGIIYIKSTVENINFLVAWQSELHYNPRHSSDQSAFNTVIRERASTLNIRVASIKQFPPGCVYFNSCPIINGKETTCHCDYDRSKLKPVIIHNNWCVGHDVKKERFQDAKLWNPIGMLPMFKCTD
mmetsp:Transcript_29472/g.33908  ORF Transcript_29472/g.33908 Transcript_29472/m.33908 type:complete len:322 (-) Transcript_29472:319-1284(-)